MAVAEIDEASDSPLGDKASVRVLYAGYEYMRLLYLGWVLVGRDGMTAIMEGKVK